MIATNLSKLDDLFTGQRGENIFLFMLLPDVSLIEMLPDHRSTRDPSLDCPWTTFGFNTSELHGNINYRGENIYPPLYTSQRNVLSNHDTSSPFLFKVCIMVQLQHTSVEQIEHVSIGLCRFHFALYAHLRSDRSIRLSTRLSRLGNADHFRTVASSSCNWLVWCKKMLKIWPLQFTRIFKNQDKSPMGLRLAQLLREVWSARKISKNGPSQRSQRFLTGRNHGLLLSTKLRKDLS